MHLVKLRVQNFRCLDYVDISPAKGVNIIVGENASGKSSLLEAIYFLARAQSFRRTPARRLIRSNSEKASVFAMTQNEDGRQSRFGITQNSRGTRIKLDHRRNTTRFELVNALPAQMIDPGLHRLLEEGPAVRRRYLDWGVFHVEHTFYAEWRRYRRCLLQRNRALRTGSHVSAIRAWDVEFCRSAIAVDECRERYVGRLAEQLPSVVGKMLGEDSLDITYYSGWTRGIELDEALDRSLQSDRCGGFTHAGPHRADLKIRLAGQHARDRVSRGQQKVLGAALLASQAAMHLESVGVGPILLIDDIAAELGSEYRSSVVSFLQDLGVQCFLTFLSADDVPRDVVADAMFHVEHGCVKRIS